MKDRTTDKDSKGALSPRPAGDVPAARSSRAEISAFLDAARSIRPAAGGRLVFALDATMSRQPTWDLACALQAEMFAAVEGKADFSVQLVYYRGLGECRASRWTRDAADLTAMMERIDCRGGRTQIGKVLRHALAEAGGHPVAGLVFIGDAMEENVDALCVTAGELRLRKVPCFMFHEGDDPVSAAAFQEIARISGGAFARFRPGAAAELAALLRAVATYAAGGLPALARDKGEAARKLLAQLPAPGGEGGR